MPVPNNTKYEALNTFLSGETLKVALYNDNTSFSFNPSNHSYVGDVLDGGTTAEEFGSGSGTNYSRATLSNVSITTDSSDNEAVLDADNITFAAINGATIQGIIVYRQVGGDDTTPNDDEIVAIIDDSDSGDLPLPTNGSDVTLEWSGEGIVNIQ